MYSIRPTTPSEDSSPPSSPAPYLDSSPASSPGFDNFVLPDADLPEVPMFGLSHPFAASVKATRLPPQYEKKRLTPPLVSLKEPSPKKPRHVYRQQESESKGFQWPVSPSDDFVWHDPVQTPEQIEAAIWDEASTKVVDEGHGAVDLDNKNLTNIPEAFVADLAKFYIPPESSEYFNSTSKPQIASSVRPLTRASTAPASEFEAEPRLFSRTRSTAAAFGLPREKLQLILSSNKITTLPLRLMTLHNLSVLSIRGNLITHVPPEIVGLTNLRTLNLSNNRIKFLPAETLQMTLTQLQVHPNPFLEPPPSPVSSGRRPFLRSSTVSRSNLWTNERQVSDAIHRLPRVIPLVEMAFRILFSPSSDNSDEVLLAAHYDLPLDECPADPSEPPLPVLEPGKRRFHYPIPSHLRIILEGCVPDSVFPEQTYFTSHPSTNGVQPSTSIGVCPSPRHQGRTGRKAVFVRHAEERLSWEQTIAGVRVGGVVPVQWRGCHWGCLDFLSDKSNKEEVVETQVEVVTKCDPEMDDDAVQLVQFDTVGSSKLDFD